jgi:pSer/pThr/pTyr-binding forkhead associated (FHA) protein
MPAAAPAPASSGEGKTEYINVGSLAPSQVVGVLVAVEGELEGQIYGLQDGENRVGRSATCQVELSSKKVSREHAKIIHQDGVFAIAPLSEQNPTLVNDEATEGGELRDGDYVKVGRTTLRFRSIV